MEGFEDFVEAHWAWSQRVFGAGRQTRGITGHIEKEVAEIRAKPDDLIEWVDVMILALDGYLRHGGTAETILRDLRAKQATNFARAWSAPTSEDTPVEHDRSGEGQG